MEDLYGLCAILSAAMFLVLLNKFDKRFGKVDNELEEIKKRMNDLLKAQEKVALDSDKSKEILPVEPVAQEVALADVIEENIPPIEKVLPHKEKPLLKEESIEVSPNIIVAEGSPKPSLDSRTMPKPKQVNYEKFIGENLFGKIGILIFVVGVGFFVKYAIDNEWINETMRTILGFLTGAVLLAVAGRLHKKYRTFSSLLAGGAFAVFYLTVAIAFHYYHLFSQTVAFLILVCVTLLMSLLSVIYNRRELAVISLLGGFLAPFITSSGQGNYLVLFTYLSVLNLGMFGLSLYKKWRELPVISFAFTYLVMILYTLTGHSYYSPVVSNHLFAFATLFYFIFLLPILSVLRVEATNKSRALLWVIIANNFLYLFLGIFFLRRMELPFKADGLLSLFIAIVNLALFIWLRKDKKQYKLLNYTILGLVLTFISITIPIQLKGHFITLLWASEMVLLLWLYVKSKIRVYERATLIMIVLTLLSYLMDGYKLYLYGTSETIFLNGSFATSLFVGLAALACGLLMAHYRPFFSTVQHLNYKPWNAIMLLSSAVISYYTFMEEFNLHLEGTTRSGVMLLFTSIAIFMLCYAFRKRFPIKQYTLHYLVGIGIGVAYYMMDVWSQWEMYPTSSSLRWCTVVFLIAAIYYVACQYYKYIGQGTYFTVYLNILVTFLWLTMVRYFLRQVGIEEFSSGFSVSLSMVGFVQMGLGMNMHQKVLRMISLFTFGIVLVKLVFVDLWAMSAIGKIIVFIILGLMLLTLSFLYQKLKDVLFKNDEDEDVPKDKTQ